MKAFSLFLFFVGQNRIIFDSTDSVRILNICKKNRIVYRAPSLSGDGKFTLWCTPFMSYALLYECNKLGINASVDVKRGLPNLIGRCKGRIGLILGAIAAATILLISDDYVWDIRVDGNESITYTELISVLGESGLCVGSRIDSLDVDAIETRTMLECKGISWIAINLQGTYANVQIREAGEEPSGEPKTKPSNLVAARDGQIDRLEIFTGNALVRHGDVVKKGDILVSGVWDSNHYGMFVTRSYGKVFARTNREFKIEIPFEYERKIQIGSQIIEKYLIFFSKEKKVFENAGNIGVSCDTIERVENLRFFNGDRLPVGIRVVKAVFYEIETARYTVDEAMAIAYHRLREIMESELSESELIRKTVEYEITDSAYILYCRVECIEDIAVMQEFELAS